MNTHLSNLSDQSNQVMESTPDTTAASKDHKQISLCLANRVKEVGNRLFAAANYEAALSHYQLALKVADQVPSPQLSSICRDNSALCFLQLGRYVDAVKESTKALELNPSDIRSFETRAVAHNRQRNFEAAIADLKNILVLDPSHVQAPKNIQRLERCLAKQREMIKQDMMRIEEPARMKEFGDSLLGLFNSGVTNIKIVRNPNTGSYICVNDDSVVGGTQALRYNEKDDKICI